MKRIIKSTFAFCALCFVAVSFLVSSCQDDNKSVVPENKLPIAPSGQVSDITFYTADITGKLELSKNELEQSEFGLLLSTSDDVMAVNSTKYSIKNFDKDYNFTLQLSGLDSVTTYYYRSYIYYEGNYIYSDVQSFTTRSPLDIIKTGSIGSDSCTVISKVESQNLIDYIQSYGICYGTALVPTQKDLSVSTDSLGIGNQFKLKLHDIPFDTLVHYRAYVRINNVDFFGPVMHFQGNTVHTGIINITDYTVTSHLKINDGYKELGVCYGIDSIPSIFNQKVNTITIDDGNDFKLKLINIPFDTIVYYRAYALTADSVYYGNVNSFGGNTVTTGIIDTVTFQVQSSVRFNDGITQYGVCYSNSEHPTTLDKIVYVEQLDSAGFYTLSLTNIPFGTVYYRSYVMKDGIAYYGDVRMFEGNSITTGDFNSESLIAKSVIKFSNSYSNAELGICYSNNSEPTIADKHVYSTVTDINCNYEFLIRNIPFGTVYYRAYMIVDGSPNYGEIKQLEGNSITINSFIDSTFTVNSSIKYSIGYDYLNLGVCYSNNENPTIIDKCVSTNSVDSLNSFSLKLTEIPFGKVYYRSYMVCDGIPQYGEIQSFDGNEITTGICDTTTYKATASLKITKGYESFDMGICYSNNAQPTINDLKISTNRLDSANVYSVQLTKIPFGTVYYRSYMIYNGVPQYGEIKTVEGNEIITGDYDNQIFSVTSHIKYVDNSSEMTYGICYGKTDNPTFSDKSAITTKVDEKNNYTLRLINIPVGSTIYYRAYVVWNNSIYYGKIKSFTKELLVDIIDLGLSVKWASFNLGADYPEDLGSYFAWGEVEEKDDYSWYTYKWDENYGWGMTKYCLEDYYGSVDGLRFLIADDDVAKKQWGGKWRTPAGYEFEELLDENNCTWSWTKQNDIEGYLVTSKKSGFEGNSIFLPAAGSHEGRAHNSVGIYGRYWTNSVCPGYSNTASELYFSSNHKQLYNNYRDVGQSIRPVCISEEWLSSTSINISCESLNLIPQRYRHISVNLIHDGMKLDYPVTWSSNNPSIAEVDINGKIIAKSVGTAIITASYETLTAQCSVTVVSDELAIDHEYVDLGLSVNWATYNVGALSDEEYGDYFAWGEVDSKNEYEWSNYYYRSSGDTYENVQFSKYNTDETRGVVDGIYVLESADDAANVKWGGNWRMPTREEFIELMTWDNCERSMETINGISGIKFISNKAGYVGRSIFLPYTGYWDENSLHYVGQYGYYWSSSLTEFPTTGFSIWLERNTAEPSSAPRNYGQTIRPVCPSESWLASTTITMSSTSKTTIPNKTVSLSATVKHENEVFDCSIKWTSDNPSVASVDRFGKVTTKSKGTANITASYESLTAQCTIVVVENESEIEHDYVDLGLGVKWATFNVGAFSIDDYGEYYAWGETEVKTERYSSSNYKYHDNDEGVYTKYVNSDKIGIIDNRTLLEPEDDVAHVKWGDEWRMPTSNECSAMINCCSWVRDTINGVPGFKGTSMIDGFTDNSIFLPFSGTSTSIAHDHGCYWSSNEGGSPPTRVTCFEFYSYDKKPNMAQEMRFYGFTVRPVHP